MGIKGLVALFESLGGLSKHMTFADLPPGTKICIDTSGFIYCSLMKNSQNHVTGILNLVTMLLKYKHLPIFVFDGKPPKAKQFVTDERKRARDKAKERLDDLAAIISKFETDMLDVGGTHIESGEPLPTDYMFPPPQDGYKTPPESMEAAGIDCLAPFPGDCALLNLEELQQSLEKERKKSIGLQLQQIQEIKQLLDMFGIPYIHTDKEADVICSKLVMHGFADYCLGNDMDMLVYGCPRVIRNMSFRDDSFTLYDLDTILSNLRLTHAEFIDMCILMGCDYTPRLLGIKPMLAYELITQYNTIENIISNIEAINVELDLITPGKHIKVTPVFDYITTRTVYAAHDVTIDTISSLVCMSHSNLYGTCLLIVQNRLYYNKLLTFCKKNCHGLNTNLITKKIETILDSVVPPDTPQINTQLPAIHPKSRRKLNF